MKPYETFTAGGSKPSSSFDDNCKMGSTKNSLREFKLVLQTAKVLYLLG